jgi:DNA-binding LytR/AlgR family response regulator
VLSAILSIVVISLPMSVLVSIVAGWFFPQLREILSPADWYLQLVVLMLPIALAYQIFTGVLVLKKARVGGAPEHAAAAGSHKFGVRPEATRLPVNAGDILAVHAEDHYLRLYSSTGSQLVYMTMSDALAQLEGADGLQVHRSWWVARRAVGHAVRRGRRAHLHLTCGAIAPVARARLADLKAAGWL